MSDEPSKIQKAYTVEEMFNMAQTRKKSQSNGRGAGLWLTSWGLIRFGFEKWIGLGDWPMWVLRVVALVLLLLGTLLLAMSFDQKESK